MTIEKLDHQLLTTLEKKYGDSYFLYNLDIFKSNYYEFLEEFKKIYSNSLIAYSYKTNYTPKLCSLISSWGGFAEVVSFLEFNLAKKIGVPTEEIIFNGPYKSYAEVETALLNGSIVNIDWPYQVNYVEQVANKYNEKKFQVGVRLSFPVTNQDHSRFGFDVDNEEIKEVIERLKKIRNIEISCLHCHFLTGNRDAADYKLITQKMISFYKSYFKDSPPKYIDVGGGFLSKMKPELISQFNFSPVSYKEYAEAIASEFAENFDDKDGPVLVTEPGISIVADMAYFVAKVVGVRELHGRKMALVSGSFYDIKPTGNTKNLPVTIIKPYESSSNSITGNTDIVGFTCMEHDVLYSKYEGPIAEGDYVVFENVGAYTNVLRPPFIRASVPILACDNNMDNFEELRRAEELDDVFSTYRF